MKLSKRTKVIGNMTGLMALGSVVSAVNDQYTADSKSKDTLIDILYNQLDNNKKRFDAIDLFVTSRIAPGAIFDMDAFIDKTTSTLK